MKAKQKKKIYKKTLEVFRDMMEFFPHDTIYTFHKLKELKENDAGGHFAIQYEPTTKHIDFYVYKNLYEEIPDLTKKQILWLLFSVAHEVGHLFIWELGEIVQRKYSHDLVEKTASDIAFLLVDLYKKKYESSNF